MEIRAHCPYRPPLFLEKIENFHDFFKLYQREFISYESNRPFLSSDSLQNIMDLILKDFSQISGVEFMYKCFCNSKKENNTKYFKGQLEIFLNSQLEDQDEFKVAYLSHQIYYLL